jgi:hypothetical protein
LNCEIFVYLFIYISILASNIVNTLARTPDPIMDFGSIVRDDSIRRIRSIPQNLIFVTLEVFIVILISRDAQTTSRQEGG